jgi:hypothetical protein
MEQHTLIGRRDVQHLADLVRAPGYDIAH